MAAVGPHLVVNASSGKADWAVTVEGPRPSGAGGGLVRQPPGPRLQRCRVLRRSCPLRRVLPPLPRHPIRSRESRSGDRGPAHVSRSRRNRVLKHEVCDTKSDRNDHAPPDLLHRDGIAMLVLSNPPQNRIDAQMAPNASGPRDDRPQQRPGRFRRRAGGRPDFQPARGRGSALKHPPRTPPR